MNRINSNTADRMEAVHGGQARDSGRGFRFGACGLFVLTWLMALSIGVAQASETTVAGTNDPTVDVQAVQDAVDHFDVVNLVGAFHFGDEATPLSSTSPRGAIVITRAGVTLRGEGKDATTITGGGVPHRIGGHRSGTYTIRIQGADAVKIHDLTLNGYLGWAIVSVDCRDFESLGVRITNGVLAEVGARHPYRYGWYFHTVTGDVLIEDCEYKSLDATQHWEDAIGAMYGGGDANFVIINNTLEVGSLVHPVWGSTAIQVGTMRDEPVGHTVRIEGNTLAGGAGIFVHRIRAAEIRNNQITAKHYGLFIATASPEESQPYVIEKNNIRMEGGPAAIKCGDAWTSPWACAMTVNENNLSGSADVGFLLEGSAQGNSFVIDVNDVENFTATTAHVSSGLDTRDNLFSLFDGADLVIVDQGTNNAFLYPTHIASATMTPGLAVPSDYALSQNVPNPFNAQTTIRVDLVEAGEVRLCLYNLCGQRIRTLVEDHRPAGKYSVVWDGRDGAGRDVASGVYLVRLEVEGAVAQIRRMVLLK